MTKERTRLAIAAMLASTSILGLGLAGCEQQAASTDSASDSIETPASDGGFVVQAVNYPMMYFASRIVGEHADVRFLAPGDGDPAFWTPSREAIVEMQSADLIVLNGASYAKWSKTVSLPTSKIVDTSSSFASAFIETDDGPVHSHGEGGEHSHGGTAFTTWLDMTQARAQAEAIRDALIERLPDHESDFRSTTDALLADIDALDARLLAAAEPLAGMPLVASHPVYQYLARRYSLEIEALLWEPEMTVGEGELAELQAVLDAHSAKWMLWEGQPSSEAIAALQGIGVESIIFDPAGNRPDAGDWLSVMNANAEALESINAE